MGITAITKKYFQLLIKYDTEVIFLIMLIVSALFSDAFFTASNLFNLLRQITPVGIISMGMLLVILTGGIDLSVGSIVAMCGVLVAFFTQLMDWPSSVFLSLAAGMLVGVMSGFFVAYRKMAPFIVTLAMMTIVRGAGFIISKGAPIMVHQEELALVSFGSGYFLGLPNPAIVLFIVFGIVLVVLRYNVFGRIVIAIGSNEEAVRLSGIKVQRYKFAVYTIAGVLSALAGILLVSRSSVGSPVMAVGMELDVIAAVVIGGASLKGGRGSALNTLLGVLILGMIGNIMNLKNVPAYPQQVIKGVIILFAVLLQRYQDK